MDNIYNIGLTKEQAVSYHRKMWLWIADNIKTGKNIEKLKDEFCKTTGLQVHNNCFCCAYGAQVTGSNLGENKCPECPIVWGSEEHLDDFFCELDFNGEEVVDGLYAQLLIAYHEEDSREMRRIALEIANLKAK